MSLVTHVARDKILIAPPLLPERYLHQPLSYLFSAPTAEAKEVMALVYLHRLHVLVTSCSEGTLVMWTVRGFEMRQRRVIVPEYLPELVSSKVSTKLSSED